MKHSMCVTRRSRGSRDRSEAPTGELVEHRRPGLLRGGLTELFFASFERIAAQEWPLRGKTALFLAQGKGSMPAGLRITCSQS